MAKKAATNYVETAFIPLDKIVPGVNVRKKAASAAEVKAMADSIMEQGFISDLVVFPQNGDGTHVLVAGYKRYAAVKLISEKHPEAFKALFPPEGIPCKVAPKRPPSEAVTNESDLYLDLQLAENEGRGGITLTERLEAVQLLAAQGRTNAQIAKAIHRSEATTRKVVAIADNLHEKLYALVDGGTISMETALKLSQLPVEEQLALCRNLWKAMFQQGEAAARDAARDAAGTAAPSDGDDATSSIPPAAKPKAKVIPSSQLAVARNKLLDLDKDYAEYFQYLDSGVEWEKEFGPENPCDMGFYIGFIAASMVAAGFLPPPKVFEDLMG